MIAIYIIMCVIGMIVVVYNDALKDKDFIEVDDVLLLILVSLFSPIIFIPLLFVIFWDKYNIGSLKLYERKKREWITSN